MEDRSHNNADCENDNTNIRNSEMTYPFRGGTDNQGYIYEKRNMLGLYALKFSLSTDVKDVSIASNVDGFESFDDMILRVEYHTKTTKLYFLQLKHKENHYVIRESELKGNNSRFSLDKFKKSYDVVKTNVNKHILTKNVSDDIILCVVTNANLPRTETVPLDSFTCYKRKHNPKLNETEDLIDNKSKGFDSFQIHPYTEEAQEYLQFFRYFRFYDGQLNCEDAEKETARILKKSFGVKDANITNTFLQFIEAWFKKEKEDITKNEKKKHKDRYILTKNDIKIKLLELLTGIIDKKQLNMKYQIFKDITNVYDYDQRVKILKNVDISLQGKSSISLYDLTKKPFHEAVPVLFLLKNIKETVYVGSTFPKKSDNYIKRQFYKVLLEKRILWKTKKIIFLFKTSLPADLNNKIRILTDLEPNNFLSYRFTDLNLAIIVSENGFSETINWIKKHKDLANFSLCHVKLYNRRYLEWQCSWSHPEDLNKFIIHEELIDERDVIEYFKAKLNVVSAIPGMGKTTVLNSLADYCKPNILALRFDLNTHVKDLQDETSDLRQNPLNYIVKKMNMKNTFEETLFNHLKEEKRLTVFIDGFDEISPKHSNAVLTLIEELQRNQISMWVFTRPLAKSILEKRFRLIAINMAPLREDDITNYFIQTVGYEINKDLNSLLISGLLDSCSVPLHLHMLVSVINAKQENLQDLKIIDLYDSFIDLTYQKHLEKRNIDENTSNLPIDLLECYKPVFLKTHKTAALIVIFGENYLLEKKILEETDIKVIRDLNSGKKKYELIVSVEKDGTPIFSHRTYAEYFAALEIYDIIIILQKEKKSFHALYELLFKENFQAVRVMFDRITAKTLPLHLAVVEEDFEKVEALCHNLSSSEIFESDEFGRTVLHFAMNNCRYSEFQVEESIEPIKIANLLIGYLKDDEAIFKKQDSILNLNFYEHAKRCGNVSLLHLAAKHGFLNIIKLLKENGGNIDEICPNGWTALHYASYNEHEECVDFLIKEGADVNRETEDMCTPLQYALETGNVKIIKSLEQKGGRINNDDFEGWTALHYAVDFKQEESVYHLIKDGADINEKDNAGRTSVHLAAENGHVDIIKLLKEKDGRIDDVDLNGLSPLHYASSNGFEDCVDYLINEGANVNKKEHDDKTPMHYAAANGHISVVSLLIEKDGEIDDIDSQGLTALHYAALNGRKRVAEFLIEAGADINKKTTDGETPMHYAAKNGRMDIIILIQEEGGGINDTDADGLTALHYASDFGHADCVDFLLSQGADVNKKTEDFFTPMHYAARSGHVNVIRLLKENRGNVNDVDIDGLTPLHHAAINGHTHCLEYLIEMGANGNGKDTNDKTPMHYAAEKGHANVIKFLNQKYGIIDPVDSEGLTPLHYAALKGNVKCLDFLVKIGANVNQKAKDYRTPMHCSAAKGHVKATEFLKQKGGNIKDSNSRGETSLHLAAAKGHSKCVEYLISEGLDINKSTSTGETPMFYAAKYDYPKVIKLLKEGGASTDSFNWDGLTVLHYAALNGSKHVLTFLLETGAYVNQKSLDGRTPVHYAAVSGHLDVIRLLKEKGAEIEATDSKGLTALHYATFEGNENYINYLIKLGTNVNIKARDGRTPIHLSAERGDLDILKLLREKGGNIYETDSFGMTPLHHASQHGHMKCVEHLLKESSTCNRKEKVEEDNDTELDELKELHSYVNRKSTCGRTSMHYAASNGHLSILKLLKEKGGIIDDPDLIEQTPLHHAVFRRKINCLDFLIKSGADVNKETLDGSTPIHFCAERGYTDVIRFLKEKGGNINVTDSTGETPLHKASSKGHTTCVKYLLEEELDVNKKTYVKTFIVNELKDLLNQLKSKECDGYYIASIIVAHFKQNCTVGRTPMHYAAAGGYVDIMMLLAEKGGRIDDIDSQGYAPFHYAAYKGDMLSLEYLLNSGADINQETTDGRTPMHCAAEMGHVEVITFLNDKGVNINQTNSVGETPLHFATEGARMKCMEYLIQAGADVNKKTCHERTAMFYATNRNDFPVILKLLKEFGGKIDDIDSEGNSVLHHAVLNGSKYSSEYLLNEGADANQKGKDDKTPMHCAAENGCLDIVVLLKQKGGRIDDADKKKLTPLHYAAAQGSILCLDYLVKANADINQKTVEGKTPLHYAAENGHMQAITFLIEKYINLKDLSGRTALHYATINGHIDCTNCLIKAGTNIDQQTTDQLLCAMMLKTQNNVNVI